VIKDTNHVPTKGSMDVPGRGGTEKKEVLLHQEKNISGLKGHAVKEGDAHEGGRKETEKAPVILRGSSRLEKENKRITNQKRQKDGRENLKNKRQSKWFQRDSSKLRRDEKRGSEKEFLMREKKEYETEGERKLQKRKPASPLLKGGGSRATKLQGGRKKPKKKRRKEITIRVKERKCPTEV